MNKNIKEVQTMKVNVSCNQAGKAFSGVTVEGDVKPLELVISTPKGKFAVELTPETVMAGILPAIRAFIITNAKTMGVTLGGGDSGGKKGERVKLKNLPSPEGEEPQVEVDPEAVINDNKKKK
jgi:hypothetical protein